MEIKIVLNNPKTGKSYPRQADSSIFLSKQIGDKVNGEELSLPGYELEIMGGSDSAGFPMRKDIKSAGRKKALLTEGPGVHIPREGMKKRKTVRGNTISDATAQVNLKIVKSGPADLEELLGIKKEEAPAEAKAAPAQTA